jgi:hypothetical protein
MLMLVALGIMSATWMSVIAVTDRAGPIKIDATSRLLYSCNCPVATYG